MKKIENPIHNQSKGRIIQQEAAMKRMQRIIAGALCAILVTVCGNVSVSASDPNGPSDYYVATSYTYYDTSSNVVDYDLHFYGKPSKNLVYRCGDWSQTTKFTGPWSMTYRGIFHDDEYTYAPYIRDISMTDFKKGEPMKLVSYPVPDGYESLSPSVISISKSDVDQFNSTQISFMIYLKKKTDTVSFDRIGLMFDVEKGINGSITWAYTGKPVCPKVTNVRAFWGKLRENVDYTVSYRNNVQPGSCDIVFKGIGKYTGQKTYTAQFSILKTADSPSGSGAGKSGLGSVFTKGGAGYRITKVKGSKEAAFTGGKTLKGAVSVPDSVQYGGAAYKVTSVAKQAFSGNTSVTSVTLGKNVRSIGAKAFSGCKKLKTIRIKSKSLKSVGSGALKGISKKAVIKVPGAKLKKYKKLLKNKGQAKTVKIRK